MIATVNADSTTTTLSPSSASPTAGTVVTFAAAVSSAAGAPFGGVTFLDGNTILGTLALGSNGTAAFSTASLTAGMHSITASYNSNGPYAESSSPVVTVNVAPVSADLLGSVVSVSQATDPNTGISTLVATVTAAGADVSGAVTFIGDGVLLGRATVGPDGTASQTVGILANATHNLTASFGGGQSLGPSVSPKLLLEWPQSGPGFSLVVASTGRQIRTHEPIDVSVEGLAGFVQTVDFSCASGLPPEYVCDFTPGQVMGASGSSKLMIVRHPTSASLSARALLSATLLIGLCSIFAAGGRARAPRWMLLLLALCALGGAAACSLQPVQIDRDFVLTIRATCGAGGNVIVHSTQIQVIPSRQ